MTITIDFKTTRSFAYRFVSVDIDTHTLNIGQNQYSIPKGPHLIFAVLIHAAKSGEKVSAKTMSEFFGQPSEASIINRIGTLRERLEEIPLCPHLNARDLILTVTPSDSDDLGKVGNAYQLNSHLIDQIHFDQTQRLTSKPSKLKKFISDLSSYVFK